MDISHPALMTTPPRRSPFSFLKSLFFSSPPADPFVPPTTPVPSRSFFHRFFRKAPPRPPHHLGSEPQLSFFDDDGDLVHSVLDRRALSPSRLSVSRRTTAHSIARLSSTFAHTSPDLSSLSSVAPAPCSVAEQLDTRKSESRTDLVVSELSQISLSDLT